MEPSKEVVEKTGMTKEQIDAFVSSDLYKLSGTYAKRNPVYGVMYEDYVQELVIDVWQHIKAFDSSKARLTTFCYCRFSAVKFKLVQHSYKDMKLISMDELLDEDGHCLLDFIADNKESVVIGATVDDLLGRVGPMTQMYLYGHDYDTIAKKFKKTKAEVMKSISKEMKYLRGLLEETK